MNKTKQQIQAILDKEFDAEISELKTQHKNVKEVITESKNYKDAIIALQNIKSKLDSLNTKNPEKNVMKSEMKAKICEQIAHCYLKKNKPKEALGALAELELLQNIIKEKNVKAILYVARANLMLDNLNQAYDYFSSAYSLAEGSIKDDIFVLLEQIKKSIKEQEKKESELDEIDQDLAIEVSKFRREDIGHTSTAMDFKDVDLVPIPANIDSSSVVSGPKKQRSHEVIEICTLKPNTAILSEFMTKFENQTPYYELYDTKQGCFNKKTFVMTCSCIGHSETGSGENKKKAKEEASKKMLKYLQDIGKLRLTTNYIET